MLSLLQVYRGFAAVLVVLYHASEMTDAFFGDPSFYRVFYFGQAGVQFFFVLSGFIIYYIHRRDVGRPAQLIPYAQKRAVRIYPVYILITLALAPFWLLGLGEPYHHSMSALISSLLLIPQSHYPHLGVAWTLVHEMLFYVFFATFIVSRQAGRIALAVWFSAIIVANLLLQAELPMPASYFLSVNNLLFGLGMLAAYIVTQRPHWLRHGMTLFVLGNLGFLAVGMLANQLRAPAGFPYALTALLFGLASFAIILQSTHPQINAALGRRKLLLLLGNASYSIYLIHVPVLSFAGKVILKVGLAMPPAVEFAGTALLAVLAGIALHFLVEKPLLRYFRPTTPQPLKDLRNA
jgi:peptidoglycan/LPS O-acetylase OafA/YrhL